MKSVHDEDVRSPQTRKENSNIERKRRGGATLTTRLPIKQAGVRTPEVTSLLKL